MESNLEVWKLAHQLTIDVYRITQGFPKAEQFGLTSQVRRSVSSVPTNILKVRLDNIKKNLYSFIHSKKIIRRNKLSFVFV